MSFKVYLAGPDVFLREAREVGKRKCDLCREYGLEGLFPLDQDETVNVDAASIFKANATMMKRADAGVFNLTPFRGPSADAGTLVELGLMFAQGKPLFGYTSDLDLYADRIDSELALSIGGGTPRWDMNGHEIESFGLADNLMIVGAIREAGGEIAVAEETQEPTLAALTAFEACLELLRGKLGSSH
jgi:nucleoside 2-deoxyribosyltransferase